MASTGRLQDKIGLVTGAARGIGEGIARALAAHGAKLYLADLNVERLDRVAKDIGAIPLCVNVTKEEDWAAAAKRIEADHGSLDILVHNAGLELVKPLERTSLAEIQTIMSVNIEGPMIGSREMSSLLVNAGKHGKLASVINVSSVAGFTGQLDLSAYSVSKAAIAHFSKVLAVEWGSRGHAIRANTIIPGCIKTEMLEDTIQGWINQGVLNKETAWETMAGLSPLNRIGDVNDIAMAAVFLASDESKFITGAEIVVDGGWMAR